MNINNVYVYSIHGARDMGIEIGKRVEVKNNTYVTLSPPGRFGYWDSGTLIINEIQTRYDLFQKYINEFNLNSNKNNIYKNDLEYMIIKRLLSDYCKKYKTATINNIPFNKTPDKIKMEELYHSFVILNPLFNKELFLTIKDIPEYSDVIVQIFNRALQERIISEIIDKTNYNMITRDLQYHFLYFMVNRNFINILDTIDEIKLFYEYYELQDKELDFDYNKHSIQYYDKFLSYFKERQDVPMNKVIYKYFDNLYKMCKNMYNRIGNQMYGGYIEMYIKLDNGGIINIYDLLLHYLPLDLRIYKPGMTIPLLHLHPFHYRYENGMHQINTSVDKVGLYQLEKSLLPVDHKFFSNFPGSIPYKNLINCDNFGEIYDKYNTHPDLIYPTRDNFIKYGKCTNGVFKCNHTIKDMMDDVELRDKVIIISACAGFTEEKHEPALRRLMSDEPQGYMKYLKYKKKYLELKKKLTPNIS